MADVVDLEEPEDIVRVDSPSSPEVQFVGATVRQPEPAPAPPPRNRGFIGANLWDLIRLQREMVPRHLMSREESFRQEIAWRARDLHRRPPDEVDMFLLGAAEEAIDLEDAMDLAIRLPPELVQSAKSSLRRIYEKRWGGRFGRVPKL
ncbi:hypothetical protein ALT_7159 [Aspergillus lentulus]|uniref:Uncharacterized protein n=1 Tax=Aspergillus lentulus TaxID=293939 RepID=A0AAN4PN77_ASPLE|nr:hypothetical protein ALT_7159 [Aspergillus lentulus]